jgi:flavin-dependent dehydrogenase
VERCDVVIVGSRLAGACAAAHLAKAGRNVVVLDKSKFPSDQLSTHLIFPAGVDELRRMGALEGILALNPTQSPWLSLNVPEGAAVLERWRAVGDIDYCLCIPRPLQDMELVRAARSAGADVRERSEVLGVLWRAGRAAGVRYRDPDGVEHMLHAELVIGADGRRSTVAAHVGAFKPYRSSLNGRGLVFRYVDDDRADTDEGDVVFQWRDGDSLGFAFPSAPHGRMLLLFMGRADEASEARRDGEAYWQRKLDRHPGMRKRVAGVTNMSKIRSTGDTTAFFRASSGPGWALAGDAGHFKDPVIGQGQRDALWAARTLAEAVSDSLPDHAATDDALRRWEYERDLECLPAYHFGNIETQVRPVPPALIEIVRRSTSPDASPDLGDLFGRARTMPQVLTIPRLATGLADALRRGTGGSRGTVLREAVSELVVQLRVRAELHGRHFRSSRPVPGSEHPHARPPEPPAVRRPVSSNTEKVAI